MSDAVWPTLDPSIDIVGIDRPELDALWDRFEIFEAIHHTQRICNPMRDEELDRLIDLLAPQAGKQVVDIACGSGELLLRCHERGTRVSAGLDLSPWMLNAAVRAFDERLHPSDARPRWTLMNAKGWHPAEPYDTVVCLGADWIWHGMAGTVAALVERVKRGGRIAYGGPRLNFGADPELTEWSQGKLESASDVEARLADCGLRVVERIDPGEAGWLAYLERGRRDVLDWQARNPGPRADSYVEAQREWSDIYDAERAFVGWSVWVADRV